MIGRLLVLAAVAVALPACSGDLPDQTTNIPPTITSEPFLTVAAGEQISFTPSFDDPDGPDTVVTYSNLPSWLSVDGDSLYGVRPAGWRGGEITVVVSDGIAADTLTLGIRLLPCIVVYGDTRTGHDAHRQVVEQIIAHNPTTVFHVGDLVADGRIASQWDTFNSITRQMRSIAEFYPAVGNHEYMSPLYFEQFILPGNEQWYSVNRDYVHFIVLNTCVATDSASDQFLWLKDDLENVADSIRFIAAVFHHPPYSTGPHVEDEVHLRETFVPLFEEYGVDIVFTGHDHDYERSYCGGIYYIVTGGGGAPLRDQARSHPCSQLFLKTYHFCRLLVVRDRLMVRINDAEGVLIDKFDLLRQPE